MGAGGHGPPEGGALRTTLPEATTNMLKAACGPGCLSLAYSASSAGWLLSSVLIVLLQCCCVYNMWLLIALKQRLEVVGAGITSYADCAAHVFGPRCRRLVDAFVTLQQLGVCCVYFGFVASNVDAVLINVGLEASETRWTLVRLMIAAYFVLAPLALIRHWKRLAPLSLVANVCVLSGIAVVLVFTVNSLLRDGVATQLQTTPKGAITHGLPLLYGTVIYSFEMVCNVLPIENSMLDRSKATRMLLTAMGIYCAVMLLVALLPVVVFGTITEGSLTAELGRRFKDSSDQPWIVLMNLLVTVAVILTYPVQFYPAIAVIEGAFGVGPGEGGASRQREADGGSGAGLSDDLLTKLLDSVPDVQDQADTAQRTLGSAGQPAPPRMRGSVQESEPNAGGATGSSSSGSTAGAQSHQSVLCKRMLLRCALVACTLLVAAAIPKLGLVISLFGSFNAPLLAMILPSLMAIKCDSGAIEGVLAHGSVGAGTVVHCLIVILGIVGGVAGSTNAIVAIVRDM